MTQLVFGLNGEVAPPRPRYRPGTATSITNKVYRDTYTRPTRNTGDSRPELWSATSVDGLWKYDRQDDHDLNTPWTVVYVPTGQAEHLIGTMTEARHATGTGRLLATFRAEAVRLTRSDDQAQRAEGQRLLGVHLRMTSLVDSAEYRCLCGGLLIVDGRTMQFAHLDACDECNGQVSASHVCHAADGHRFCGDPVAVMCAHYGQTGCVANAMPNRGRTCELGGADDCCGVCCVHE